MILKHTYTKKGSWICPFLVLLLWSACSGPAAQDQWNSLQGNALGTTYQVQYLSTDGKEFQQAELDSIIEWMNHAFSTYTDTSLVSAFNANSNALWLDTNQLVYFPSDLYHFVNVVKISYTVSDSTNWAFDPTAGLLFDAWAEAKKDGSIVPQERIDSLLAHSGWRNMGINKRGIPEKTDSALQLNFNAVAKGYVVDAVADYLLKQGFERFMVEIGGEVRVHGNNPDNKAWVLGINTPDTSAAVNSIFEAIPLDSGAMATSGNYRNYFTHEGRLLGHTLDPRTGQPVINALRSATVMHPICAYADAYATACMVLGPDSAAMVIRANPEVSAYFIVEEQGELKGYFVE